MGGVQALLDLDMHIIWRRKKSVMKIHSQLY